jgi:hypothetical protein
MLGPVKRLLLLALTAFAAWYGWNHYASLRSAGASEVVVVNHSGQAIERLRVRVADQALVVETLENGAQAKLPLRCERDGAFSLIWQVRSGMGDHTWTGGQFVHGPIRLSHRFEFLDQDGVIWSSERLAGR